MGITMTIAPTLSSASGNTTQKRIREILTPAGYQFDSVGFWSLMKTLSCLALLLAIPALGAEHPRLYLTPDRIAALRAEIGGAKKAQWEILRGEADRLARRRPPAAVRPNDAPDQLWQRDVGNALPTLAMAWVLSGDPKYRTAAEDWALASSSYPTWGFGRYLNNDLPAGHQLFGLALVYDWMFRDLSTDAREKIRQALLSRGRDMYQAADLQKGNYWRDEYLQNHLWVNAAGLAAAALALPDEPETAAWLKRAQDAFRITEKSLGPDGASQEGVGYWSYGVEYLLKFWALSADLLGEDLHSPWWEKTAMYRLYLSLPRKAWAKNNTIIDIADCPRQDYYGPDYLLFDLARRFHDPYAQWLGLEVERAGVTTNVAPFLNLLWLDPKQAAKSPADLPTLRHFEDMGIVSARSDWSGGESLVVFKSGPPAGHEEVKLAFAKDPGFGHVHPDANHFVIFGNGQWILQDDGYAWKETGQHNTLLIDGVGQMGEHAQWFRRKTPLPLTGEPSILTAESHPDFDVLAGDATGAYATDLGLRKFVRRVIFWKPNVALVLDAIETDRPRKLELRFHPPDSASVRIEDLTPDAVVTSRGTIEGRNRENGPLPQYTVKMEKNASVWRNVTAISWGPQPAPVTMRTEANGELVFQSAGKTLRYTWPN
jgi:hypothetical protein